MSGLSVSQALMKIKRQFGDEYGIVIDNDDIYGWIYEAELDIIRNTGCNDTTIILASTAFPFEVPVAVNFKRLSINGKALQHTTVEEIDMLGLSLGGTTSSNQYWYRVGTQVNLWPATKPSGTPADQIAILYNKTPVLMDGDPLTEEFSVPEVYYEDVVNYCIGRAHNKNNNLQAEQVQMGLYDKNLATRRDEAQSIDAPLYKGDDPLDFIDYDVSYN